MKTADPQSWMWSEALEMLARAERMHRDLFKLRTSGTSAPCWEPPVDILETRESVLVFAALPGVVPDEIETRIEEGILIIAGRRDLPPELRNAVIHRLELPQGGFERSIAIPAGRYSAIRRASSNGYLIITLDKAE